MIRLLKQLFHRSHNQRGNILASAFISMVILSLSLAGIAQLTVNQFVTTKVKLESIDADLLGEGLLKQSIYDFELYLNSNTFDVAGYYSTYVDGSGYNDYGILVEDVSNSTDLNGDYTDYDGIDAIATRFTYIYNDGNSYMRMYSFASKGQTYTESIDPYLFQMATNGDLILNSGYLRNPNLFGDRIVFTNVAPYINEGLAAPAKTPAASGVYPDFNGNGSQADTYYREAFYYCEPDCYTLGATVNDNFVLEESEFLNVEIEPNSLETGNINADMVIANFFSDYALEDQLIEYVQLSGPTEDRTVTDSMTISTIGSVIYNDNAGDAVSTYTCIEYKPNGTCKTYGTIETAPSDPYARLNTFSSFDPANSVTVLNTAGIYNGNLTISEDFTITNFDVTNTETMIVWGDLTIDNVGAIDITGMIVVLGDLYFTGDDVTVSGGFYVTGQTFIEFNEGEGFVDSGGTDHKFSLYGMDNIMVTSLFETHGNNTNSNIFNWFVYTEESIYIDAVNNVVEINGVLYAAAKGNSGNEIPMEDESGNPIRGIVVNSFNGYVRSNGTVTIKNNYFTFDFDPVNEASLGSKFVELPDFETVLVQETEEGSYERTEVYYNN
ncbi:hypothetical protein [Candidatus Xianfuyuplasma coldseepsis]|uniref:Uncharacterized protein n=1 Tax=Candidatus Xianfuyuplasma coldseepsis TaxID=2782163 RepID=A0A7L7KT60_9MOLU|nr:hypothetical protein [Xianfuyuplasma coldseepsis]QMS85933.1 hypothetical protein G4Z02_09290 [Xianfuyuplasma coldseepsis]